LGNNKEQNHTYVCWSMYEFFYKKIRKCISEKLYEIKNEHDHLPILSLGHLQNCPCGRFFFIHASRVSSRFYDYGWKGNIFFSFFFCFQHFQTCLYIRQLYSKIMCIIMKAFFLKKFPLMIVSSFVACSLGLIAFVFSSES